ncbi:uncharacterized protein CANTADRAFT_259727 [Suhomyces tanzawaensis NRRL Y-17324]|uniref:C2H2-type domain-containing protein n=1 Tax=Suhomyces tanzawaensis NRRL Y-17324 TaxID=984487 RepID=A0A1E4SIY1_9ASCO|nr:uncharacterized protein CANTADRAFT_259727 [Suhomyces tanzawaensis NRRL Y-17324]ODV79465.1 hypothetical protein CANTADRAFT_259727 [Suhomyces tanzawaensis NRRL Y-17324]
MAAISQLRIHILLLLSEFASLILENIRTLSINCFGSPMNCPWTSGCAFLKSSQLFPWHLLNSHTFPPHLRNRNTL